MLAGETTTLHCALFYPFLFLHSSVSTPSENKGGSLQLAHQHFAYDQLMSAFKARHFHF